MLRPHDPSGLCRPRDRAREAGLEREVAKRVARCRSLHAPLEIVGARQLMLMVQRPWHIRPAVGRSNLLGTKNC